MIVSGPTVSLAANNRGNDTGLPNHMHFERHATFGQLLCYLTDMPT
jgi:hypothetical protein